MRDLTPEEVQKVNSKSKPDGSRPFIFNSSTSQLEEIGRDLEVFIILAPNDWKNDYSNFLNFIADNDIGRLSTRDELRDQWLEDESIDISSELLNYDNLINEYSALRGVLVEISDGFETLSSLNDLSLATNKGMSEIVPSRDSVRFSKSVFDVLKLRHNASRDNLILELKTWAQALISYN